MLKGKLGRCLRGSDVYEGITIVLTKSMLDPAMPTALKYSTLNIICLINFSIYQRQTQSRIKRWLPVLLCDIPQHER